MRKTFRQLRTKSTDADTDAAQSSNFPQGLISFADPEGAVVDIVFVHGLTGDRQRTWTHPNARAPWPQTLLPSYIPNARIVSYGYDAYVLRPRASVSTNRLRDHSRDLLNALTTSRAACSASTRPLIFVVHSLGGLLCKDMLLISRNHPEPHLRTISEHTRAIAFLGTPHTGSVLASWAKLPVSSLGIVASVNRSLLSTLETRSEVLSRINEDFISMLLALEREGRHIEITCFYETLPMPVVGQIVPQHSATLPGHNAISIHANHRDLVRYLDDTENGFSVLVGELRRWSDEAQVPVNCSQQAPLASQAPPDGKMRCLKSLTFPEMDLRHRNIDKANESTCKWIEEAPSYKIWEGSEGQTASEKLLWIKGKPGSGKSTLMKSIIASRQESFAQGHNYIYLAFFFNARGAIIERSPIALYKTLLYQLLDQSDVVFQDFYTYFRRREFSNEKLEWQLSELSVFFHEAITNPQARGVEIFVDALDECEDEEVRLIVKNFEKSVLSAHRKAANLRICWSSRHYPHININQGLKIRMESGNASDIERYINQEMHLPPEYDRAKLTQLLIQKASGTFLWIVLVVRRLLKASDRGFEQRELEELLNRMPDQLEDYFADILDSMDPSTQGKSLILLQLVLFSMRPLNIAEVNLALKMSTAPAPRNLQEIPGVVAELTSNEIQRLGRSINDLSGGLCELIDVAPDNTEHQDFSVPEDGPWPQTLRQELPTVQVIHEAVRDFLLGEKGFRKITDLSPVDSLDSSHAQLARICSEWLCLNGVRYHTTVEGTDKSDTSSVEDMTDCLSRYFVLPQAYLQHTFTSYALDYMSAHMSVSGKWFLTENISDASEITRSRRGALKGWLLLYGHSIHQRLRTRLVGANATLKFISQNAWAFHVTPSELSSLMVKVNTLKLCFFNLCPAYNISTTLKRNRQHSAQSSGSSSGKTYYQICWAVTQQPFNSGVAEEAKRDDSSSGQGVKKIIGPYQVRAAFEWIMGDHVRMTRRVKRKSEVHSFRNCINHMFTLRFKLEANPGLDRMLGDLRRQKDIDQDFVFGYWSLDVLIVDYTILTDISTLWSRIVPHSEMDQGFLQSQQGLQQQQMEHHFISLLLAEEEHLAGGEVPAFEALSWNFGRIPKGPWTDDDDLTDPDSIPSSNDAFAIHREARVRNRFDPDDDRRKRRPPQRVDVDALDSIVTTPPLPAGGGSEGESSSEGCDDW